MTEATAVQDNLEAPKKMILDGSDGFKAAWDVSLSLAAFCAVSGLSRAEASKMATKYRKEGVDLKRFPVGRPRKVSKA